MDFGQFFIESIGGNILWILLGMGIFFAQAPFITFQLIRRNRSLGRDIYREVAQADRFMEIWSSKGFLSSSPQQQYVWPFVPNQNPAGAQLSLIDAELSKRKLVTRVPVHGLFGGPSADVKANRDAHLWLRNWTVFLLLLWLRVTIFGDRFSHIVLGGGLFTAKQLKRWYWETTIMLIFIVLLLAILLVKQALKIA